MYIDVMAQSVTITKYPVMDIMISHINNNPNPKKPPFEHTVIKKTNGHCHYVHKHSAGCMVLPSSHCGGTESTPK